jgi:hypothetical protein
VIKKLSLFRLFFSSLIVSTVFSTVVQAQQPSLGSLFSWNGVLNRVAYCAARFSKNPHAPLVLKLELKKNNSNNGEVFSAAEFAQLETLKKSSFSAFQLWEYILRQNQRVYKPSGRPEVARLMDAALKLLAEMNPNLASATVVSLIQEMQPWSPFFFGNEIRITEHETIENGPDEHVKPYFKALLQSPYLDHILNDPNYPSVLGHLVGKVMVMNPVRREPELLKALGNLGDAYLRRFLARVQKEESILHIEAMAHFSFELAAFFQQMESLSESQKFEHRSQWKNIARQDGQNFAGLGDLIALAAHQRSGRDLTAHQNYLRPSEKKWKTAEVSEIYNWLPVDARPTWQAVLSNFPTEFNEFRSDSSEEPEDRRWKLYYPFSGGLVELEISLNRGYFFTVKIHVEDALKAPKIRLSITQMLAPLMDSPHFNFQVLPVQEHGLNSDGSPETIEITLRGSGLQSMGANYLELLQQILLIKSIR